MSLYLNSYYKDNKHLINNTIFYLIKSRNKESIVSLIDRKTKLGLINWDKIKDYNSVFTVIAYSKFRDVFSEFEIPCNISINCYSIYESYIINSGKKLNSSIIQYREFFSIFYGVKNLSFEDVIEYRLTNNKKIKEIINKMDSSILFQSLINHLKNVFIDFNNILYKASRFRSPIERYFSYESKIVNKIYNKQELFIKYCDLNYSIFCTLFKEVS